MFDLNGKTALITGGSRGLGRSIAEAMARAGANIVLVARDADRVNEASKHIHRPGGRVLPLTADVGTSDGVAAVASALRETDSAPDILVNCAGTIARGAIGAVQDNEWQTVIDVNVTAVMRMCRIVVPGMRARGWGRIINIASISALGGMNERTSYCSTKAAVLGFTRALAVEVATSGITVNAISPGSFPTDFNKTLQNSAAFQERLKLTTPLQRWGRLDEIAGPAVFLASEAASYITGHNLVVDGGTTASL